MPETATASASQPVRDLLGAAPCVNHPDRNAQATCPRCGAFVCETCVRKTDSTCPSCVAHLVAELPSLQARGRLASGLILATTALGAVLVGGVLNASASDEENMVFLVALSGGLLLLGAMALASIVVFLMWQHLAVRTANVLGHDIDTTPGWAVGWWFVPFANLWLPYHVVRSLLLALGGERAVLISRVGLWWTFWVASWVFDSVAELGGPLAEEDSLARPLITLALQIGAAMFAAQVITTVGRVAAAAARPDVVR